METTDKIILKSTPNHFLTQSKTIKITEKDNEGALVIEPHEIRFESINPGTLYIMTFSVRNNSTDTQRIRLSAPHTGFFALNYIPSGTVAPGLDIRAEIECQLPLDSKEIVFTDKVIATMGSSRVELPIYACKPYATLKFNRILNCGTLVLSQSRNHLEEIVFENIGNIVGKVKLSYDTTDSFIKSISPLKFDIDIKGKPKSIMKLKVVLDPKQVGEFRELIRVSIAGTIDDVFIEICVIIIEPRLTLLTMNGKGILDTASFGSIFYGETRKIKGYLVNSSPMPLNFTTLYEEEEETIEGDSPLDEITLFYAKSLTIIPPDGIVKPFSQILIEFKFNPILYIPSRGFQKQITEDNLLPRQISRRVKIECSEADQQKIPIIMQGEVMNALILIQPSVLRFGECPVNDRRDILLSISNKTNYPTNFLFPVVANFKFLPSNGILQGFETISVTATFIPPQLGEFKGLIKVSIANDLKFVELHAIGYCNNTGTIKKLYGGTDKLPQDFEKKLKFVNSEEEAATRYEKQRAIDLQVDIINKIKITALKEKIGNTSYIALPKIHQTNIILPPKMTITNENNDRDNNNEVTVGNNNNNDNQSVAQNSLTMSLDTNASSKERDYMYGMTSISLVKPLEPNHPYVLRKEHDKVYKDFLLQSNILRQEKITNKKQIKSMKLHGAIDFKDPLGVNMGMERGLDEPEMKIPIAGEPLWLKSGVGTGNTDGSGTSRIPIDEDRLIVKKYSTIPATQAELRDCSVELTPDDLKHVIASHKTIDYKTVSVGSSSAKNFFVTNDLKQSVMVKCFELDGELQQSKHLCQIIPQGCTAGFDIYFSSRQIGKVRKVFIWKINNIHVFKVTVLAEVVPIVLEMTPTELIMEFPIDSLEETLNSDIILRNPGNAPADFLWGSAGAFQCSPDSGTISPNSNNRITITWSPLLGKRNQEELGLHITGGIDQTLKVKGITLETKAEFIEKRISLGLLAVGTEKIATATIKNIGINPLVFFLNPFNDKYGIIANPSEGYIQPGDMMIITLNITPKSAISYDNVNVSAKLRGGKQINVKLSGSSEVPSLVFIKDTFQFGPVTVGSEYHQPLWIENQSTIMSTLFLDLSSYPEFKPCIINENSKDSLLLSMQGIIHSDQEDSYGNQIIRYTDQYSSTIDEITIVSTPGGSSKKRKEPKNTWTLYILPNSTIKANLVFRPTTQKTFNFKLPLYLQGLINDKTYTRDVTATSHSSTFNVSNYVIDFEDRVVSRDSLSRSTYFLETTIQNIATKRGITFEIIEDIEIIHDFDENKGTDESEIKSSTSTAVAASNSMAGETANQIFFVAPLKGSLAPGQSIQIRATFQPQSSANYSKKLLLYIKDQPDPTRPYLTFLCHGSGVYPRLTFSLQHIELPPVPLNITSRALFYLYNNGYNALTIKHRVSPNIPLNLEVTYPDGDQIGVLIEKIRVVISAKSEKSVSWTGKIEFYDQDGERFFISVGGYTDNCMLTNYPFIRDYSVDYGFVGIDNQPVRYMKKTAVAELRLQEAKRKEELRRQRSLERMKAVEGKSSGSTAAAAANTTIENDSQSKVEKSSIVSKNSKVSKLNSSATDNSEKSQPVENEGVDVLKPDQVPFVAFSDREFTFLLRWLNKNICRKKFDVDDFLDFIVNKQGEVVFECIEQMSGKKIPTVKDDNDSVISKTTRPRLNSQDSMMSIDPMVEYKKKNSEKENKINAANKIVFKYQQLLNFLINNGALLAHINPVNMLDLENHLYAQEYDLTKDQSLHFTPAMLNDRRIYWEQTWSYNCKKSWIEILYQSIKIFILSRVTYKDYTTLPGIVLFNRNDLDILNDSSNNNKKKSKKNPPYPKDYLPSNVFTHAEGILLAWVSYHLDRASKLKDEGVTTGGFDSNNNNNDANQLINFNRRVTDFDHEFRDLLGFCKLIHSHVSDCTNKDSPLHGYTAFDNAKGDDIHTSLVDMLRILRLDLEDEIAEELISTRNILLLVLHFYLNLPNFVPKTKIEFVGDLGNPIRKQIILENPSNKSIKYEVILTGSTDYSIQSTELIVAAESSNDILVTLQPRFFDPVIGKVTFRSIGLSGLSASTICFDLSSLITGRKPVGDTILKQLHLFEQEIILLHVKNPFAKDAVFKINLHVQYLPSTADDYIQINNPKYKIKNKKKNKDFIPVLPLPPAGKIKDEENELELTFRQPFWVLDDTISLSKTNRELRIYVLPFSMGKYKCLVSFSEKDSGEFCREIIIEVGLPKSVEKVEFSTVKDNRANMALRLSSKNLGFEKAFNLITESRIKNPNKKIKARSIYQSLLSSPIVEEETGQSNFHIELLSSFFEYKKHLSFVSEYMKLIKNEQTNNSNNSSSSNILQNSPTGSVNNGGGTKTVTKYKKMLKTLVESVPIEESKNLESLNTAFLSFVPSRAGQYQSVAVVYSNDNPYDVRVVDIIAHVAVPDTKMILEFNGPSRQLIKQQIPITNETKKDWVLSINCQGKAPNPFSAAKNITIPAGDVGYIEVSFYSLSQGKYDGQLLLRNYPDSTDTFEYKLIGVAEEPLAEDELRYKAVARETKHFRVHLNQILPAYLKVKPIPTITTATNGDGTTPTTSPEQLELIQTFHVESDLPYIRFPETIDVGEDGKEFSFSVKSPMGGSFSGNLTFLDTTRNIMIWYTVTIDISAPNEEKSIDVEATVRKAAIIEVTLDNPSKQIIIFDVSFHGDGLIGENMIELPAESTAIYELIYSPLIAGKFTGRISFVNKIIGILWYKLNLTALPANPIVLDVIESMIGSTSIFNAPIENPLSEQVVFSVSVDDIDHFSTIPPDRIVLNSYAQTTFKINFRPSSLHDEVSTMITLTSPKLGEIQYYVTGRGVLPGTLSTIYVDAPLGEMGSQTIIFRNPFSHPLPIDIVLTNAEPNKKNDRYNNNRKKIPMTIENAFGLLMRKSTDVVIPPKSNYHIAISFSPTRMGQYEAIIQVRSDVHGHKLLWCYPVVGLAESGVPYRLPMMKVACKASMMKEFNIPLEGMNKV